MSSAAVPLDEHQTRVVDLIREGVSIHMGGEAGIGKSHILKAVIAILEEMKKKVAVTAMSGTASVLLPEGTTLHYFAGLGYDDDSWEKMRPKAATEKCMNAWGPLDVLIIDEISMMSAGLFEKLEKFCCEARKNYRAKLGITKVSSKDRAPFDGVQLVLIGDFLQLPPIDKHNDFKYAFESPRWSKVVTRCIKLTKVYRQDDAKFVDMLRHFRMGVLRDCDVELLATRLGTDVKDCVGEPPQLHAYKTDVAKHNAKMLQSVDSPVQKFQADYFSMIPIRTAAKKGAPKQAPQFMLNPAPLTSNQAKLRSQLIANCQVDELLNLKVGVDVLLIVNYSQKHGLVNGSRGRIVEFSADEDGRVCPVVQFSHLRVRIRPWMWNIKDPQSNVTVTMSQIPLIVAYAITIHKCQGMSLQAASINLSNITNDGQAYVALSRLRTLDGLKLLGFSPSSVRANPRAVAYEQSMEIFGEKPADIEVPAPSNTAPRSKKNGSSRLPTGPVLEVGDTKTDENSLIVTLERPKKRKRLTAPEPAPATTASKTSARKRKWAGDEGDGSGDEGEAGDEKEESEEQLDY